ncbi:uncharacterized protein CMU_000620 [Cryptosporidium muris RN66]|uniref:Zinc finger double-stranded RNA binding domain-containing protein n=1 Tax=Cryptosporidium muris (strain RN66) TaxID=441375 RepID=B6AG51_CRYMR|nr:uncharacterized protein CMU_000620 [Cryptosporidium muris RN66]EEA07192.1 hypothetical protein, conserved [Cryptosporidium muris RN66]|eukprot:XP_002141541.1 hypothetical protein [Cryptosporidium muris RN66]
MIKRLPLYSTELLESVLRDSESYKEFNRQIRKVFDEDGDEDDSGQDNDTLLDSTIDKAIEIEEEISETDEDNRFPGKFHCKLCPEKRLISKEDLEKHVKSRIHQKRVKMWESDQISGEKLRRRFNKLHNLGEYSEDFESDPESIEKPSLEQIKEQEKKKQSIGTKKRRIKRKKLRVKLSNENKIQRRKMRSAEKNNI